MSYSVSSPDSYPHSAVVFVVSTYSDGSKGTGTGVVVGDNDVLTAAHVVYDSTKGAATSVTVYPGYDEGQSRLGSTEVERINYNAIDSNRDGLLTYNDSEIDIAVLGLGTNIATSTGTFGLSTYTASGYYYVTGYPGVYATTNGHQMIEDYAYAYNDYYSDTFYTGYYELNPGNSGGPIWKYSNGLPYVEAIVSTKYRAAEVAENYDQITGWIDGNNDLISSNTGTDTSSGSDAADTMIGGSSTDTMFGRAGDDRLSGAAGADVLYGNVGEDYILGGSGSDILYGGQNTSPADSSGYYRSGVDTLVGGSGEDIIYGNFGGDMLSGGADSDTIFGGQDDDTIYGGGDDDVLFGNLGNDLLYGDSTSTSDTDWGWDTLYGGAGSDTAVYLFSQSNYSLSETSDGGYVLNSGEYLYDIEYVRFSDALVSIDNLV